MAMTGEEIHGWLNNIGLLPEHRKDTPLADLLKDGISLCRLINRIKPGSVSSINTGYLPENAHQNIEKFIQACRNLGIQESFVPSDLLEMKDFDQVLNTLQALYHYSSPTRSTTGNQKSSQSSMSADDEGTQCVVKALYNFTGTGDDELSFQKGDLIMVTKVVDGGWWEGIMNDQVGWFPGNHVEEISPAENCFQGSKESADKNRDSLQRYYDLVVKDIVDSEEVYTSELMSLISVYLTPLKSADVLTSEEVSHLTGNLPTLAVAQDKFFTRLKEMVKLPAGNQMIASLFMDVSTEMGRLYTAYCMNHPRAVAILTENSDKLSAFMESKGAPIAGMLVLTQNLSKPMRRLEKYPTLLEELQRHIQDDHKDKKNVENAINFYSSLLTNTQEVRKKKEDEYEMLSSTVKGYAGKCLMELGECSCVVSGSEVISAQTLDERFYLVFPGFLVILAVGQSLSGYELQYKFPLSSITVRKTQDEAGFLNAIEIIYNNNKSIQTSISTVKDMKLLLETIAANGMAVDPSNVDVGKSPTGEAPSMLSAGGGATARYSMQHRRQNSTPVVRQRLWGFKSLRPTPPLGAAQIMQIREEKEKDREKSTKSHKAFINVTTNFKRRSKLDDAHATPAAIERVAPDSVQATTHGGDTAVLRVIEAYCLGSRMKQASMLDRPIASSVIPIRQVPSAPPMYTLPRHASTTQLEQKRPASPKKNRRFSFMPGRKDTSQAFVRSPLRHSLRELSSHKKEQSGSLPDFTQFTPGKKNKNKNVNNNNNNSKHNETHLLVAARVLVATQHPELNSSGAVQDDGGDDLMHTQSETSLTASSNFSLDQVPVVHRRSSSSDNLRTEAEKQKPALRAEEGSFKMLTGSVRIAEDHDRQDTAREAQPRKKTTQSRFSVI